jgi:rhodanese-related sulfurtransferase
MKKLIVIYALSVAMLATGCSAMKSAMTTAPRMTNQDLLTRMESDDVIIIDVRASRYWEESTYKITGAVREDPRETESWAHKYDKTATIVLYCS